MRRLLAGLAVGVSLLAVVTGCAGLPMRRSAPDVPQLVRVDDGLYRGGQPTMEGVRHLSRLGVRTIVNLRRHSAIMDEERHLAEALGMRWVSIPIWAWGAPSEAQLRQFLAIANDAAARPVFVHCRLGRNRAGVMVAVYRIVHDGWPPERAYAESCRLGMVPWNPVSRHVILRRVPRAFVATAPWSAPPDPTP